LLCIVIELLVIWNCMISKRYQLLYFFNNFEIKGSCYFMPRKWFVMYSLDFWILIFDGLASFLCKQVLCYVKIGYFSSGFRLFTTEVWCRIAILMIFFIEIF
jgi:hypothetical protein